MGIINHQPPTHELFSPLDRPFGVTAVLSAVVNGMYLESNIDSLDNVCQRRSFLFGVHGHRFLEKLRPYFQVAVQEEILQVEPLPSGYVLDQLVPQGDAVLMFLIVCVGFHILFVTVEPILMLRFMSPHFVFVNSLSKYLRILVMVWCISEIFDTVVELLDSV